MTPPPLGERVARLELPATPSTGELLELARRDVGAALRTLDDFGWFWDEVQELVDDKARELLDTGDADDEDDAEREAWAWLRRLRPDVDREDGRLQQFAWNLARTARDPAPLRAAARDHRHWAWPDLELGLRRRRLERRGVDSRPELGGRSADRRAHARQLRPRGRRRGAGRPGARRTANRSGSSSSDAGDSSDSDGEGPPLDARRSRWAP